MTLEEVVAQLKRDPEHPVRTRVGDLTIEVRAVPEPERQRSAAEVFAEVGPWAGESTDEILRTLAEARRAGGRVVRIRTVEPLDGFWVRLSLTDGSIREVDLRPYLNGPVFEPVRNDPAFFRRVSVDEELGTIVWPNGADIDPDVLILGRAPVAFGQSSGSRAV